MPIYLVQHGKNRPQTEDPDEGLSAEGVSDTERIAAVAKGYNVKVAAIYHSVKKRARQTAEIMAEALMPAKGISEKQGLKAMDDVQAVAATLDPKDSLMLVGHLPFMSRLTALLITGDMDRPVFAFQNSGIVCLDKRDDGNWIIKWTLMPNIS